jgi:hypothetical protein
MSNIIEKIAIEIAEQLMEKLKNGYIPELSKKYNIPEKDLIDILEGGELIRAKPKEKTPKEENVQISIDIEKINTSLKKAVDSNKYLNISTMKAVSDNKTNRSKLLFNDTYKIVAKKDDEDLFNRCVVLLSGDNEEEVATDSLENDEKENKKIKTKIVESDSELESSESEEEVPIKAKSKKVKTPVESDVESEEEVPIKAKAKKVKTPVESESSESEEESVKPKAKKVKTPVESESSESEEESVKPKAKKVKTPVESESSESEEESVKPKAKKVKTPVESESESEEVPVKAKAKKVKTPVESESESEEVPVKAKAKKVKTPVETESESEEESVKPLKPKFHKELKKWWNEDTGFLVNKQGFNKYIVVGRVVNGKVCNLTEKDMKKCGKMGWNYRNKSKSESTDSSSCSSS